MGRQGHIEEHVALLIGGQSIEFAPPRIDNSAGPHGGNVDHTATGLDCSHPGNRELLNTLVGATKIGIVSGGKDDVRARIHHRPEDFVIDDVEADGDTRGRSVDLEYGVAFTKRIVPRDHRK